MPYVELFETSVRYIHDEAIELVGPKLPAEAVGDTLTTNSHIDRGELGWAFWAAAPPQELNAQLMQNEPDPVLGADELGGQRVCLMIELSFEAPLVFTLTILVHALEMSPQRFTELRLMLMKGGELGTQLASEEP